MEEKKLIKRVVFMMCMLAITLSSIFIIGKSNVTYALDRIDGYRYHSETCNKYYITTCSGEVCYYSKINNAGWSGTVSRNSLRNGACNYAPTKYTVYFNLNYGVGNSTTSPQVVAKGGRVTKPTNPTKSGYSFAGWTINNNEYNFNSAVNGDLNLFARWVKNKEYYTITFNSNGGTGVSSQKVEEGSRATRPSNPTRSGYTFIGWYTASGSVYNFNSGVTSNITLYAHWKENAKPTPTPTPTKPSNPSTPTPTPPPSTPSTPSTTYYKVIFDLNGGTGQIDSQSVEKNGKVTKPSVEPTKSNTIFNGWYTSNDCKNAFNFDKKITKETTIYACYTNSYNINVNKVGLPFNSTETKKFKEGSNLQEYNQNDKLTVFDITTYSMVDKENCSNYLSDIRKQDVATEKCNNIEKTLKCNSNNCYSNKYLVLDDTSTEEIVYLKKNGIIKIEYEVYNYNGLFRDRTCNDKYTYSNKITSNMDVYACYAKEGDASTTPNIDKPTTKNTGKIVTLILIILAILSVVGVVFYFVRKAKIANSVD